MKQILTIGMDKAREALSLFCKDNKRIVLVTDGAAYGLCGAEKVMDAFFAEHSDIVVTHLVVPGANPKVEMVAELLSKVSGAVDGFISVGGGTTIDTTKLLNLAIVSQQNVKDILESKNAPDRLKPFMALPTTAGTGAEATRFAVCYDGDVKHSIDFEAIRPSDVALVPEFTFSLPQYQTASTGFDAYAQAIESLWAKGATDESREYARRALGYLQHIEEAVFNPTPKSREAMLQGAYWAGRAIDISRTTAAHAFSYYMTSKYGIPHGHAVAMMFPFILKANADAFEAVPEIKTDRILSLLAKLEEAKLESLPHYASRIGIEWGTLVDDLFNHVNLKRLGNNPCEVKKDCFQYHV